MTFLSRLSSSGNKQVQAQILREVTNQPESKFSEESVIGVC